MVDGGQELGLAAEAREAGGVAGDRIRENLDRHVPPELGVAGAVDNAHAAGAEPFLDPVVRQRPADERIHRATPARVVRAGGESTPAGRPRPPRGLTPNVRLNYIQY